METAQPVDGSGDAIGKLAKEKGILISQEGKQ
jgi:hypothetical protein